MQTAMFCTGWKWCNFVACTTVDFHCKRIECDKTSVNHSYTSSNALFVAILPELTLQHKSIREPKDWIMDEEAFLDEMMTLVQA